MGSKSSSAPAPDPRLVEAQIRSMGYQDQAVQQLLANSTAMLPYQQAQMQFGLDTARQAYMQSQQDRDWMLGRRTMLGNLQSDLINEANSFDSESKREELAGKALGDVSQVFATQRGMAARNMARSGVNPADGKFAAMSNQMDMAEATAKATAANKTREAARQEGFGLKQSAANMMSGYPAMGMQATGAGAGFGGMGLQVANQGLAGMNSGFGAAGGLGGQMGQNATGMWNAQANYKNQQDQIAASNDPFGTILGAATGVGMRWALSDRRLKTDVVEVGIDPRTGLKLYEFAYKDGSGKRYRGVMADEAMKVNPDAVYTLPDGYMAVNYTALGLEMVEV